MATDKQVAANRRNAKRSTGPKTMEGKDRARRNALKHGLCERAIGVLDYEDYAEFQVFRAQLITDHRPVGALEAAMVEQIAQSYWRMLRATRMETGSFNLQLENMQNELLEFIRRERGKKAADRARAKQRDHDAGLGFCLEQHAAQWLLHMRYQTTATRDFHRAINTLLKLQQVRRVARASARCVETRLDAKIVPFPTAQLTQTAATSSEIGFVPQSGPKLRS